MQQACVVPRGGVAHHHGLLNGEVRQQHVILHDVARDLPEAAQVPGHAINEDCPLHAGLPAKTSREVAANELLQHPTFRWLVDASKRGASSWALPSGTFTMATGWGRGTTDPENHTSTLSGASGQQGDKPPGLSQMACLSHQKETPAAQACLGTSLDIAAGQGCTPMATLFAAQTTPTAPGSQVHTADALGSSETASQAQQFSPMTGPDARGEPCDCR